MINLLLLAGTPTAAGNKQKRSPKFFKKVKKR